MSTITASRGGRGVAARAGSPLPTRERRPGYVALAVVLIVGLAALGAWLYSSAGAKVPVVIVTTQVPAGQTIQRSDLSTISVSGGVQAFAGNHLDTVIGERAAVTLLPGMLLQSSMVTASSGLGADQAEVGVKVTSGQIPADGLKPGDTVEVLQLPSSNSASASKQAAIAQELVPQAKVSAVQGDPAQAGGTLLTLVVPSVDAAAVATASGAGQVALVRVGTTS